MWNTSHRVRWSVRASSICPIFPNSFLGCHVKSSQILRDWPMPNWPKFVFYLNLISCVTWGKSLDLSRPQITISKMGLLMPNFWGCCEKKWDLYIKPPVQHGTEQTLVKGGPFKQTVELGLGKTEFWDLELENMYTFYKIYILFLFIHSLTNISGF